MSDAIDDTAPPAPASQPVSVEVLIRSIISVVAHDMRSAAEKDIRELLRLAAREIRALKTNAEGAADGQASGQPLTDNALASGGTGELPSAPTSAPHGPHECEFGEHCALHNPAATDATPEVNALKSKWSLKGGNRNGCDAPPEAMEVYDLADSLERRLRAAEERAAQAEYHWEIHEQAHAKAEAGRDAARRRLALAETQRDNAYARQWAAEQGYPDTEADGAVFCGKCGARR